MVSPTIPARIEQFDSHAGLGVDGGYVGAFVPIAEDTGVRQIIESRRPSVLAAYDVIDLVSETRVVFENAAILATMSSPARHVGA